MAEQKPISVYVCVYVCVWGGGGEGVKRKLHRQNTHPHSAVRLILMPASHSWTGMNRLVAFLLDPDSTVYRFSGNATNVRRSKIYIQKSTDWSCSSPTLAANELLHVVLITEEYATLWHVYAKLVS